MPGDIGGLEVVAFGRVHQELTAANPLGYRTMRPAMLRELMGQRPVALRVSSILAETRWRMDRHLTAVSQLDAHEGLGLFLLDIHDRLRRRELITRATFNLPLTQEQIADHLGMTMVHVNRTIRRLREEGLVLVAKQVATITDLERLRALVSSMPPLCDRTEPVAAMPAAAAG